MVNRVKAEINGTEGGAFYINEFSDVIVPAGDSHFYAGSYSQVLEFDFDGSIISPEVPPGTQPGDIWSGPRVGIPYTLTASCDDIKYEHANGRTTRTHLLSDYANIEEVKSLARRISSVKGSQGGRIYINEKAHFFGPVAGQEDHLYLGSLDDSPWFPPPDVPGRS